MVLRLESTSPGVDEWDSLRRSASSFRKRTTIRPTGVRPLAVDLGLYAAIGQEVKRSYQLAVKLACEKTS